MITRPLDLQSRLSAAPRDLDFFAWVNVAVIVVFFTLLGSRFVLAPGLLIGTGDGAFVLPATASQQRAASASIVVSYRQDDVILFEGAIVKPPELQRRLDAYGKQHPGEVLLLLADKRVSAQAITKLSVMAQSAGFAYVLMAAESPGQENSSN